MKKHLLAITALAIIAFGSCSKDSNNNGTTLPVGNAFTVTGVHDVIIINGTHTIYKMPVTVTYNDSGSQTVALSVSGLPAGVNPVNADSLTGTPTFNANITLADTGIVPPVAGDYTVTVTATGSVTGAQTYTFTLTVVAAPPSAVLLGVYTNSHNCAQVAAYTDSVFVHLDSTVNTTIWFHNFSNGGKTVYALYNSVNGAITLPSQTFGDTTYSGSGGSTAVSMFINTTTVSAAGTSNCTVNMYR